MGSIDSTIGLSCVCQMRDVSLSQRLQVCVCVLAAASAVSLLTRRRRRQSLPSDECVRWRMILPEGAAKVKGEDFGETGLQARMSVTRYPVHVMRERSRAYFDSMNSRRTMRFYSTDDIPQDVLELCLATAGTSPSGAHHQPWFFAVVKDANKKRTIRDLVEAEEKVNYDRRMKKTWVDDLKAMTGNESDDRLRSASGAPQKPYLTEAPAIIAMFKQTHGVNAEGKRIDNYYVNESCGIAAGVLITALHNVGLGTLTSTPMGAETAIRDLLGRPDNEKLFLLLPVGYPADDATVPYRTEVRKPTGELFAFY